MSEPWKFERQIQRRLWKTIGLTRPKGYRPQTAGLTRHGRSGHVVYVKRRNDHYS